MKGVQKEQENQVVLKELMDLQQECETQAQQYEAQADDISKILDQIKTGTSKITQTCVNITTWINPRRIKRTTLSRYRL